MPFCRFSKFYTLHLQLVLNLCQDNYQEWQTVNKYVIALYSIGVCLFTWQIVKSISLISNIALNVTYMHILYMALWLWGDQQAQTGMVIRVISYLRCNYLILMNRILMNSQRTECTMDSWWTGYWWLKLSQSPFNVWALSLPPLYATFLLPLHFLLALCCPFQCLFHGLFLSPLQLLFLCQSSTCTLSVTTFPARGTFQHVSTLDEKKKIMMSPLLFIILSCKSSLVRVHECNKTKYN